ncbi:WD40 repeat domain-containing protein [Streptomyces griseiscabiei]|uniref:AAA family ATPase n=1 Tax=Streptomyces griseiscabiei TaxID=2993540 RepID=A0ABU4L6A2_9ACTN|nr:AAA family ATPase [Streptomyces griseiscabiei]MDX2911256.1 AAA family ATPase [Streptomyces griseiscabiei]
MQHLAHDLRELRRSAGAPSYRSMAEAAGCSASSLSQAAAGQRLPTLVVLRGYVRACGADPAKWESRWRAAEAASSVAAREENEESAPPYRGLARFEPDDRGVFFGRDELVEELRELVCKHRFAVVFGASGSGKSSLLRAGLIPCLQESAARTSGPAVVRVLTPGARPAETYGRLLTPAEGEPDSWVVVDQFEEVFTLCRDRQERKRFIDLLLTAREPDSKLRVVVAMRADFFERCTEHSELAKALRGTALLVGPMNADALREVVVKPAAAAGLLVERELTARMVAEVVDQPGGLPMLSHALLETWRRRQGRVLTTAAYEAAGGVRGAIAATAERVFHEFSPAQARTARHVLLRLVEPGDGTADTRRPMGLAEFEEWADPEVPVVVDRLARARLLTMDEERVELAHEALITCWPRLAEWIEQTRERLRCHLHLIGAARAWEETDRDPGALYRGIRLARAEALFVESARRGKPVVITDELTKPEQEFLAAALDAREAEGRAATRTIRRVRLMAGALSAVLAVALLLGQISWRQHRDNERQRADTVGRQVAQTAASLRSSDPRTAMLLGAAAWRLAPQPDTRRALLGALAQPELDAFTDYAPSEGVERFLADSGRTLLTVRGRAWQTWDVPEHRLTASGRLPDGQVLATSPDARVLALLAGNDVRLWDRDTGRWTGGSSSYDYRFTRFGFAPAGRAYLVDRFDKERVQLRSLSDGRLLFETDKAGSAAVSTDARLVVACSAGRPQIWDVRARRTLPGAWQHDGAVCGHSPTFVIGGRRGGERLVTLSDTSAAVWDIRSGRHVASLGERGVQHPALSGDGRFLAAVAGEEIRVWRLSDPESPVFRYGLHQEVDGGLAWDPDHPVLRYPQGDTVRSLDLGAAITTPWRVGRPLSGVLLSPDARTFVTAGPSGADSFELRDTHDGHLLRTLPSPVRPGPRAADSRGPSEEALPLMAFSPDGDALVYGVVADSSTPQRLGVWDLRRGRQRGTLTLPVSASSPVSLALGPHGHTLYASLQSDTGEIRDEIWDTVRRRRTATVAPSVGAVNALRPDGRLVVGDGGVLRLPSARRSAQTLGANTNAVALAFGPPGTLLAVGDSTGRVALWDDTLRHRTGLLEIVFPTLEGDLFASESISALAISPDGRTLAVGGNAGALQLWDLKTRQQLGVPLTTPGERIDTLAFSTDSGTLYAGSAHAPFQRYPVDTDRAVARICARADGANLSRAQWRTVVADTPYRRIC